MHWSLDDIGWEAFDPAKVDPVLLRIVKAASLVEGNAADYVAYLEQVFAGDAAAIAAFEDWGREEEQHGRALGRWAELADPEFNFEAAFTAFRAGYKIPDANAGTSVRGSRTGEMISRCVVESGTSSYYAAMRDIAEEPVLKQIAAHIAADEFRHYRLFFETLCAQSGEQVPFLRRLMVALSRVSEAEDDELAYAYYCANTAPERMASEPYARKASIRAYQAGAFAMYRERHITKAAQMIAKAVGAPPRGRLARLMGWLVWQHLRLQTRHSGPLAA